MRGLVIFLLVFMLSVFVGLTIAKDPGLALFSYQHWSVEMPLWFAVSALILLFFIGFLILKLFNSVGFSLYRWKNWRQWRRRYKSYSKTNRGLLELIEGNWKSAENYLVEGIQNTDLPLINLLAAAKAAHEQGRFEKRDTYLKQAHDIAPQADIAIGLTQAQLQCNQGQLEQALATLNHLRTLSPKHPSILKLLERVYVRLGDWQELLSLIPALRKAKVLTSLQAEQLEKKAFCERLRAMQARSPEEVQRVWETIPKKYKTDPELVAVFVSPYVANGELTEELDSLIKKAMKERYSPLLARLYGVLKGAAPAKQLQTAEGWAKHYPDEPVLLMSMGLLAQRCQLWGKARTYFEASLKLAPMAQTFAAMGQLLESLNEPEAASANYREGLLLQMPLAENELSH